MDTNEKPKIEEEKKKIKDPSLLQKVKEKYFKLKAKSGSHSPSALVLQRAIPEINLSIDCCFLSNPFATISFMNRIKKDFSDEKWLSSLIESYQNA